MPQNLNNVLTNQEVAHIAKIIEPKNEVIYYEIKNASEKVIGYLGEHLKLKIKIKVDNKEIYLNCFVKCLPFDPTKAEYIRKCNFFRKEYAMLCSLFKELGGDEGPQKWRPRLLYYKDELFVFEDVTSMGYVMPHQEQLMKFADIKSVVITLANFHASSIIYEEKMEDLSGQPFSINQEFKEFLKEPEWGQNWRNAGMKAVIDILLHLSKHKHKLLFSERLYDKIPKLYEDVLELMKPSKKYRNVIVHRDLWANNIFLKNEKLAIHAIIVDFQTVLYTSPLLDLASLLYFNTNVAFRNAHTMDILHIYYEHLSGYLKINGLDINIIMTKEAFLEAYEESVLFGLTQASIIVPIISMGANNVDKYFNNPETFQRVNEVSRSEEILEMASVDAVYKQRIMELFEEIADRYVNI